MSKTTWNILGILTIVAGTIFFMSQPERFAALSPEHRPKFIAGSVLIFGILATIVITCFLPVARPVTLRIIGVIGIASCIFNLIEGGSRGYFAQFPVTLGFWFPGSLYLVVKGKMS